MALFRVSNNRAQFDAAGNEATDQYGAGIRYDVTGDARVTTGSATNYNQGIPMSATGQVAIVDATAGLPAGTIFHNGLPISGDKVCVSRNATAVVSNGMPYDAAGAVAGDINFDLNFIGTNTLNSSVTFTRASSATFTGSNGLIQSAAIDAPRFDYDPVTLAAKGLLIEEQRTNLLTYSEDFTNAAWVALGGAKNITPNTDVAPDGSTTADTITDNSAVAFQGVQEFITVAADTATYTASVYVKKTTGGTSPTFALNFTITGGTAVTIQPRLNTDTGVVIAGGGSVQNAGNYWRLICSVTNNASVGNTSLSLSIYPATAVNNSGSDAATATGSAVIWGAQVEQGSFATSYIPTVASQVTRSADVASVNTLSPWYNAAEGTLYAEASKYVVTTDGYAFSANSGAVANQIGGGVFSAGAGFSAINAGGVAQTFQTLGTLSANTVFKIAVAAATNNANLSVNGAVATTDTSVVMPTVTLLDIGKLVAGTYLNGHIRRITYYPRRLSNAELVSITS